MTNKIFTGYLIDVDGNILLDYNVVPWYVDPNPLIKNRKLGTSTTNSEGEFILVYSPETDDRDNPDETIFNDKSSKVKVEIRFIDEKIYETTFTGDFTGEVVNFGTITVKGPNRGVKGRILDENNKPLSGLVVLVLGEGAIESSIKHSHAMKLADRLSPVSLTNNPELGSSKTDKNGYFEILYPPSQYNNILNEKPDIMVVIKDSLGVAELFRTKKYPNVTDSIKNIDDIQINRDWAEGWYVTLGGSEKSRYTMDNRLEILIDNEIELENLVRSINNSSSYVYLTQFEFDPEFVPTFKSKSTSGDQLINVLRSAGERGVDVKIILNENLVVPDTYKKISDYFKSTNVEIREFKSNGLHVMHVKTMTVDGKEAYVIGSPFKQDYWDTHQHLINDPRRKPEWVRPVHDVSVKLQGGSVHHVEEFFIEMWNYISDEEYDGQGKINHHHPTESPKDEESIHKADPQEGEVIHNEDTNEGEVIHNEKKVHEGDPNKGNVHEGESVQIVRSITPETLTKKGELGIFEGYRRAIAQANDFIYLENQFFTNSSILKALKNAMKANDDLQVIVVLNENPDIPGYKRWQNQAIEKLGIKSVDDILEHSQIGFFTLWSTGMGETGFEIQPIYVHTKMAVVDDIWATVGTANLDGSSLTHVNELKGFFDAKFHRNMEMNVILPVDNQTDSVKKLRNTLWEEHLGKKLLRKETRGKEPGIVLIKKPKSGWLEIWQETAKQNIKSLNKNIPYLNGQILPYSQEEDVKGQLDDLKIDSKGWNLLESE